MLILVRFFSAGGVLFEVPDLSAGWLNQQRQSVAIAQHILGHLRLGGSDLLVSDFNTLGMFLHLVFLAFRQRGTKQDT